MALEALGETVDLVEQLARHFTQRLRLAGRMPTASLDCAPTWFGGLLEDLRVIGEHLAELRGLLAERVRGRARMLAEHPLRLDRALAERRVDRLEALGEAAMTCCVRSVMVLSSEPVCWTSVVSIVRTRWSRELANPSARSVRLLSKAIVPCWIAPMNCAAR